MTFGDQKPNNSDEDIEFIDADSYTPQQQGSISYEQIVLEQIRRCVVEGSKEMGAGGYFKDKYTSRGYEQVYIPDQKEVYKQCVDSLHDLLLSFFDDEMKEAVNSFNKLNNDCFNSQIESLRIKAEMCGDNQRMKNYYNLQINSKRLDSESIEYKQYSDDKLRNYRYLYQQLLLLFGRKRYLMAAAIMA